MPNVMNAADAVLMPAIGMGLGQKTALLWRDRAISYSDLLARVCQAAHLFAARGLKPDDRVVLLLRDSPDFVACYLGAIKAGGVAVAVNLRCSGDDLAHVLDDSAARILVVDRSLRPIYEKAAPAGRDDLIVLETDADTTGPTPLRDELDAQDGWFPSVERETGDMAFWIYTSGTTGTAKAAVHRQQDVLFADGYAGRVLGVTADDVLFATSKLFFAYSLGTCLFASLQLGATTVLYDEWPDAAAIADVLDRTRPTVVFSVPTMYRNMLGDGVSERPAFAKVRHYVSAGERMPAALWQRWHDATGVEILDGMGTSETIYMLLTNWPGAVRPGTSGTASPEAEIRLADAEGGDVGADEPGILWARIPSRCSHYWNRPETSAEVFRDDWFRTGDMYLIDDDGYWTHQGRHDDMLKISGQWVSPAEIEETVMANTTVREAAVVDTETDDELVRTMLFAVGPAGDFDAAALEAEIRTAIVDRLSPYKCPKWIRFIDEIPRTATGKVQRFRLRAMTGQDGA